MKTMKIVDVAKICHAATESRSWRSLGEASMRIKIDFIEEVIRSPDAAVFGDLVGSEKTRLTMIRKLTAMLKVFLPDDEMLRITGKERQIETPLAIPESQKRIAELRCSALSDKFAVGVERDSDKPMDSRGAILLESYLGESDLVKAYKIAESLNGRYGETVIYRLVEAGSMGEVREAVTGAA